MNRRLRLVTFASATLASAAACIATVIEPQWFELLFDEAPDGGNGSLEMIVAAAVSAIAFAGCGWLTRREWRARAPQASALSTGR